METRLTAASAMPIRHQALQLLLLTCRGIHKIKQIIVSNEIQLFIEFLEKSS